MSLPLLPYEYGEVTAAAPRQSGTGSAAAAAAPTMLAVAGRRLRQQLLRCRPFAAAARPYSAAAAAAPRSIPVRNAQQVVESQCELGESPVWCTDTETLFWVDCLGHGTPKFWSYHPTEGRLQVSDVDPMLCSAIGSIGTILICNIFFVSAHFPLTFCGFLYRHSSR